MKALEINAKSLNVLGTFLLFITLQEQAMASIRFDPPYLPRHSSSEGNTVSETNESPQPTQPRNGRRVISPYNDPYDRFDDNFEDAYTPNSTRNSKKLAPVTEVTRDEHFIYIRTPWKDMKDSAKAEAIQASIELLQEELEILFPKKERSIESAVSKLEKSDALNKLIKQAETYAQIRNHGGFTGYQMLPSALMFYAGGKFSANFKFGGGPSFAVGLVVMPSMIQRISLKRYNVAPHFRMYQYMELDWAMVFMPSANIGVGAGGGTTTRVGVAAIWGDITRANQFSGPIITLSKGFTFGVGIESRAGVLRTPSGSILPFAAITAEFGAAAATEVQLNGSLIMPLDQIFDLVARNNGTQNFSGSYEYSYFTEPRGPGLSQSADNVLKELGIAP